MKINDRKGVKYARDNIKIQVTSLRETKQNKTKNHDSSGEGHPFMNNIIMASTILTLITPRTYARDKAIVFVCLSVYVCHRCRHHEITRSQVLGICACCNYHKLVDIGEKLVSVHAL